MTSEKNVSGVVFLLGLETFRKQKFDLVWKVVISDKPQNLLLILSSFPLVLK